MKTNRTLFIITQVLTVIGCFLPLYEIDTVSERCGMLTIIVLLFNCIVTYYVYTYKKKYTKLIIIPELISLMFFIVLWSDIADKFSLMDYRDITYRYKMGFYFLLTGIFSSIVVYVLFLRKESPKKEKILFEYITNKKTGSIKKKEIHNK